MQPMIRPHGEEARALRNSPAMLLMAEARAVSNHEGGARAPTSCFEMHRTVGKCRLCDAPQHEVDRSGGDLLFASTNLDQAAQRSQKHDDVTADATQREIDTGYADRDAAEQRHPHQDVPERPRTHPLGKIQPMQAAEQPSVPAASRVGSLEQRTRIRVEIIARLFLVSEDDAVDRQYQVLETAALPRVIVGILFIEQELLGYSPVPRDPRGSLGKLDFVR
jgi:hypothetical protein